MSRSPGAGRPRDPEERPRRPEPDPYDLAEEPSTFQPTPAAPPPVPTRGPVAKKARPKPGAGDDHELPGRLSTSGKVRESARRGPGWAERIVLGSVSSGSLAAFSRQLAAYLEAGVDLRKSLSGLGEQFSGTAMAPVIQRLREGIQGGLNLSEAMGRETGVFDGLTMSMVRVGEAHGGLPEIFRQVADHYENRQRLYRQAVSALLYPVIVLTIALGVIGLLSYFVLPKLVDILKDMTRGKVELPGPTKLLIAFTDFVVWAGWWVVPLVVIGGGFTLLRFYRTSTGKGMLDRFVLYIPVFGKLCRMIDTTRFARTLSTLLEAGVPVDDSLRLTSQAQMMAPYRDTVAGLRAKVMDGEELSEGLRASRLFPVDAVERVATGEETGKLPEMLAHLADDYEEQTAVMVRNLGTLVQPLITIGLGAFVGFIAIAFILAYVSILGSLGSGI